jgi:hypothetical protein
MSDDDVKTRVQNFCAAHRNTIKSAIENNIIRLNNRMLGHDGKKHFESGMRDLIPIIDNSQLPVAGYEALTKIITGLTFVTFGAAYAEATKTAIISKKNREAATAPRSKDLSPIREFIKTRIKRNPNISNGEMLAALDSEADNGMDGRIEFSEDKAAFVVCGEGGNHQFRLARKSVPKTIFNLKKKRSGR